MTGDVPEMVERVARAICRAVGQDPDGLVGDPKVPPVPLHGTLTVKFLPLWKHFEPSARAAIEAMREPTEAMLMAGSIAMRRVSMEDGRRVTRFPSVDLVSEQLGKIVDAALGKPS